MVSMLGNLTNMPSRRASGAHNRSLKWLPMRGLPPEVATGEGRAFDQCPELGPLDLRVHPYHVPALRESAVGTGNDVLLAHGAGVVLDAPGHQLRVLHHVGLVADDARDQDLAVR